jgi:transcriptional regulator with XRE-family HTH domain
MSKKPENEAFSERLRVSLLRCSIEISGASELATQFNLRHAFDPITPQAAHKWLNGAAVPSSEKIKTLAEWLGVSPHWLRYGSPDAEDRKHRSDSPKGKSNKPPTPEAEQRLVTSFRDLSERQRNVVLSLIDEFRARRLP